jgi:DNA-binding PadR family transcriptional regulator
VRPAGHGHGWHGHHGAFEGGRVRRGGVRDLLLAALVEGPAHGYELMRRLQERSGGRWRPSPGSVYPLLQLFADQGLVAVSGAEGRKVFELTAVGRAQADQGRLLALAASPDSAHAQLSSELEQLRAAARQVAVFTSPETSAEAVNVLRRARQDLYRLLAGDTPQGSKERPDEPSGTGKP